MELCRNPPPKPNLPKQMVASCNQDYCPFLCFWWDHPFVEDVSSFLVEKSNASKSAVQLQRESRLQWGLLDDCCLFTCVPSWDCWNWKGFSTKVVPGCGIMAWTGMLPREIARNCVECLGSNCCLKGPRLVLPSQHLTEAPSPSCSLIHWLTGLLLSSCWKSGCFISFDKKMMWVLWVERVFIKVEKRVVADCRSHSFSLNRKGIRKGSCK